MGWLVCNWNVPLAPPSMAQRHDTVVGATTESTIAHTNGEASQSMIDPTTSQRHSLTAGLRKPEPTEAEIAAIDRTASASLNMDTTIASKAKAGSDRRQTGRPSIDAKFPANSRRQTGRLAANRSATARSSSHGTRSGNYHRIGEIGVSYM